MKKLFMISLLFLFLKPNFKFHAFGIEPSLPFSESSVGLKLKRMPFTKEVSSYCSGVAIAHDVILTLSSCLENISDIEIFQGNPILQKNGSTLLPQPYVLKGWETFEHLSLIFLKVNHEGLKPVPVFDGELSEGKDKVGGEPLAVVGYGSQSTEEKSPRGEAAQINTFLKFMGAQFFTAFSDGEWQGACPGDEGAPAFVYEEGKVQVAGLFESFFQGPGVDCSRSAQRFLRLAPYLTFIKSRGKIKKFDDVAEADAWTPKMNCPLVSFSISPERKIEFMAKDFEGTILGLVRVREKEKLVASTGYKAMLKLESPNNGLSNHEKWQLSLNSEEKIYLERTLWQNKNNWELSYKRRSGFSVHTALSCF